MITIQFSLIDCVRFDTQDRGISMTTTSSPTNRTLADLSAGQTGLVTELHSQGPDRRRMMDLGIVPGTLVTVEMKSPLGDPVAYRVRGALVALRHEQACLISITDAPIVEENRS
jgi:ferrous iron transport protein A